MNGLGFSEHGGIENVRFVDIPEPVPGPGEVRVRLKAASFNRLDLFTLSGIPGVTIDRPHVLGSDGSGVVEGRGQGVEGPVDGSEVLLNPGIWDATCDACRRGEESMCRKYRILGEHTQGTATQYVVVPARNVHPKPARLSFESAAAAPLVFQTAWRALSTVGQLRPGESCAIIGAGGGVATAAIQVAKRLGARVVVATRSPDKAERARSLGATETVVFGPEAPLEKVLWQWSGKNGVDVVFDSVGEPTLARSVQACARGGRVVVVGATGGPRVEVDLRTLFWRQASIRGSTMAGRSEFETVLGELDRGTLRPVIDSTYPLTRGVEALERMGAKDLFGKVVLDIP